MNTTNCAIMGVPKYECRGAAQTALGVTPERLVPMLDNDTPSNSSIPESRQAYWSDDHNCYLVPLTQGKVAMVDALSLPIVRGILWYANSRRGLLYASRCSPRDSEGKQSVISMHRIIAGAAADEIVDHINGNSLDNRRANLRICTAAENNRNACVQSGRASVFKGVKRKLGRNNWIATIKVNNQSVHLGTYLSEIAAASAYDIASVLMHGEFGRTNVVAGILPEHERMSIAEAEALQSPQSRRDGKSLSELIASYRKESGS